MPINATDATTNAFTTPARFVGSVSGVDVPYIVVGLLQIPSKPFLNYRKMACPGASTRDSWGSTHSSFLVIVSAPPIKKYLMQCIGWSPPKLSTKLIRADSLLPFRLEKAIEGLRPPVTKVDPTTNFWTTYKKVAGEHDNDMVSKYVGDLDTSMLFVSTFTSREGIILRCHFSAIGGFILGCHYCVHCPNHSIPPAKPQ